MNEQTRIKNLSNVINKLQGRVKEINENYQQKDQQITSYKETILRLANQLKLRIQQNKLVKKENLKE
jgi:hypothetical protein